ncbi:hypothetical protein ASPSYDRAFT_55215 [Aspergillus sydowii CBS 593.65]|uniref:DUF7703 domain-containing protein n=1 Tax=Aspergillus sydowii CBS 593.65 TaxID=1036612 RepID=A0A1L9TSA6_9EURO|nr:uncharacterized protein ASPSYDRAFT_55215 [Aspergillus sydowii CBS 593.65]OJJ62317.1 hypothetical protein ASPSYDRAFT_55215 [Aspergillus sydowii CBS 593.65]
MSEHALPGIGDDPVVPFVLAAFATLVYYNAIELIVLCSATFKRCGSLYFWCLLITSIGLIPHVSGYVLLFFRQDVSQYAAVSLIIIGWICTVTGQSLVLWSRLHFVCHNPRLIKGLLVMIVVNAFLLHTPTTVLLFGTVSSKTSSLSHTFSVGYNIMERIQLVGFCIQEIILSGVYVWETAKMLRLRSEAHHRRILAQLLAMNVVMLIIDLVVVIVEYIGFYSVQVMFKPVAYSVKLKLEYAVLGRLVQIAQGGSAGTSGGTPGFHTILPSSAYGSELRNDSYFLDAREGEMVSREPSKISPRTPSDLG